VANDLEELAKLTEGPELYRAFMPVIDTAK
jgi:hypothetical protein